MALHRESLRHLERGPETVNRSRRVAIGRANDDVTGERVLLRHVRKRGIEVVRRHSPRDESPRREIRRHQRLANSPNHTGGQHRPQTLDHDVVGQPCRRRYLRERLGDESGDSILRHGENPRVDRIRDLARHREGVRSDRGHLRLTRLLLTYRLSAYAA